MNISKWTSQLLNTLQHTNSCVQQFESNEEVSYKIILFSALKFGESNLNSLSQGDKVALIIDNSAEYIMSYLACTFHGLICIPIPYFLSTFELKQYIELLEPKIIITDRDDFDYSTKLNLPIKCKKFTEFELNMLISKLPSTKETDIESIYLSSGTTGRPKGIKYTHGNKYSLISSICTDFKFNKSSRHLAFLPFGHTAALNYSVFPSLFVGSYMLIAKKFDNIRTSFFRIISNYYITYVQTVPTVISALLLIRENTLNLDLKSIPFVGCGSAPLAKSLQDKFYKTFRKKLANLYGLSETGPTHYDDPTAVNWQPGSIGKTLSVNQCKLGVDGEILIKGENVFTGYYKDDKATQESFDGEWFKTGDFGEFNNGILYFTDRKKDMLIIGGINVYPAEIENVIKEMTGIEECLVFGIEDKILGNKIIALINSLNLNFKTHNDLKSEVIVHCRSRLSNFKIPNEIRFVDHIPQTASGKLSRKAAKTMYLGTQ